MRTPLRGSCGLFPRRLIPLALIAVIVSHPFPAGAQGVTGAVQGTVISPEGAPEPDVHVTVAGPHLQGTRSTMTDRDGFFQFLLLPPGPYEILMTIRDDLAGQSLELREPFTVGPPLPATASAQAPVEN